MNTRLRRGFTLFETLIAMFIFSGVSAICIGAYLTLQRGFVFMNTWSDVRNAQVLVIDTVAQDLRNATKISGTISSVPIVVTGTSNPISTLIFSIPQFYSDYFPGSSYADPPVHRAGTPVVTAATNALYVPLTSGTTIPTATVVYSGTTIGSSGRVDLVRTLSWNTPLGPQSASRSVAIFPNGAKIAFNLLVSGSAIASTSSTNATAVRIVVTGTAGYRKPIASTLQDTVFLRAYHLEK